MGAHCAAASDGRARQGSRRRSTSDQRHPSCAEERLPVVRLPAGRTARRTTIYNRFVRWAERGVWETAVPRACRSWPIDRDADDRYHAHQGAPLGLGRKRGEQKQAIGRSRGGRNTKIHAIADAKGRLLSILLSGGEAHDCPPAPRLIRRTKAARKLLGDKAYDSAPLTAMAEGSRHQGLSSPTSRTASNLSASTGKPTSNDTASRMLSVGLRTSAASPLVTTGWRETSSPPSASLLLSSGGFYEFGP